MKLGCAVDEPTNKPGEPANIDGTPVALVTKIPLLAVAKSDTILDADEYNRLLIEVVSGYDADDHAGDAPVDLSILPTEAIDNGVVVLGAVLYHKHPDVPLAIFVAVDDVPENAPENPVAVSIPVCGLKDKPVLVPNDTDVPCVVAKTG